ncbi:MAG: hypothetical protein FJ387_10845 [Verrucomicrobia bacterium]|nr:hypothetical protein [Verrucomicrobiota bacterium]
MSNAVPLSNAVLSDPHKETVKGWVPRLRKILDGDFEAQLKRFGFSRDGRHATEERLTLPADILPTRRKLAALIERDTKGEGTAQRGFDAVVREHTYTLLNRLVGLKAMEARGLLFLRPPGQAEGEAEATEVITPVEGQAYSRYLRDFRAAGGSRYKYQADAEEALLRDGLMAAFREVNEEIRTLFDPDHDYACLWPSFASLQRAISSINSDLPPDAYRAPDFLGWVYQFFNRDEKKIIRDENKGTPRSSYELSVINQFYTPLWVVKVLVDNTLGRLWLQMHPDSSLAPKGPPPLPQERRLDLAPVADYLVPRTGEKIRYRRIDEYGNPQPFKRARDIKLLDPACGTLHFGQYAFGLFYQMYLDEIANAGKPGWPAEPSVRNPQEIPAAIIENNLYGIDIDPRAIQIASLSLILTAKEAALQHGFSPTAVRIRRSNLVIANAVQVGEEQVRGLVNQVGDKAESAGLREKLFETLWLNLKNVGELGSLVQVSEGVTRVLSDWVDAQAKAKGLTRLIETRETPQLTLESIDAAARQRRVEQLELQRKVIEDEAARIRSELLAGLERLAGQLQADPRQRLFAEDTARGLRLLEVLSLVFDVVVMNPPYGGFVPVVKEFIADAYPLTKSDIYAAFIERATQLIEPEGYVGALVSSTFRTHVTHTKLRTEFLLKRNPLVLMLDLGYGILDDATVEAAAIVLRGTPP